MEKELSIQNDTYEFIGRLALALYGQNVRMSYATLMRLLEDNGLDNYGSERGMARGIEAAYHQWEAAEEPLGATPTCNAIALTFVDKDGNYPWRKS